MLVLWTLAFLLAQPAWSANNAVNDACKDLCSRESECVRRCIAHAELFELNADFIRAVTDFTKHVDDRMRALRSGADIQILELCKETGWSLDNMMICLRSYPSQEVIRNCKKLSPRQEDQVQCVRLGKAAAAIDACNRLTPSGDLRLECLGLPLTVEETKLCGSSGGNSNTRMKCLERTAETHEGKTEKALLESKYVDREKSRKPTSVE